MNSFISTIHCFSPLLFRSYSKIKIRGVSNNCRQSNLHLLLLQNICWNKQHHNILLYPWLLSFFEEYNKWCEIYSPKQNSKRKRNKYSSNSNYIFSFCAHLLTSGNNLLCFSRLEIFTKYPNFIYVWHHLKIF